VKERLYIYNSFTMRGKIFFSEEDYIRIEGLEISSHVGITDQERAIPQEMGVSLTLWTPLEKPGLSDRISDAVDYAHIMNEIRLLLQGKTFNLIETMAEKTARHLLVRFDITKIKVEISKLSLPGVKSVTASVTRSSSPQDDSSSAPEKSSKTKKTR
jgi:7,8-dihydroneopterin aldolase/epimerase/oxygenase